MGVGRQALERSVGYPVTETVVLEDRAIVRFETEGRSHSSEFPAERVTPEGSTARGLPTADDIDPNANVCAVDLDGNLLWTIEPQVSARSEARYTALGRAVEPEDDEQVWTRLSDGRVQRSDDEAILVRHTSGYAYQIDPADGAIVETLTPATNTITVGDQTYAFEYAVHDSVRLEEQTVVRLGVRAPGSDDVDEPGPFRRNVVAIDDDGELRWHVDPLPSPPYATGYNDLRIDGDGLLAKHTVFGWVPVTLDDGSIGSVSASTKYNVLFPDETTAVCFPVGLGEVVDRAGIVVARVAPDDWADSPLYEPGDELLRTDDTPLKRVVDKSDRAAGSTVVGVRSDGEIAWEIEQPHSGDPDSGFTDLGTHLQLGDNVWARHGDGCVYHIDETTGEIVDSLRATQLRFPTCHLEFPYPVDRILELDDLVVVLLDAWTCSFDAEALPEGVDEPIHDRNVLGFDRSGTFRWCVDAVRSDSRYASIWWDGERIQFWNLGSYRGEIDPQTGEILDAWFSK